MSGEKNIAGLLGTAMDKLGGMVNVNTVVGQPIMAGELLIVPISRVSMGFVAGGGEYTAKQQEDPAFGGGSGGGMSVNPVGFFASSGGNLRYIPVNGQEPLDKLVDMTPDLLDKLEKTLKSCRNNKMEQDDELTEVADDS
ncbi:MAG: sporulation protein YtfJ [Firmicutes bacterium]|nr:sporulation protein YtfJ [Bacillota bacterium]